MIEGHNSGMPEPFRDDAHCLFDGSGGARPKRPTFFPRVTNEIVACDATQASDGNAGFGMN